MDDIGLKDVITATFPSGEEFIAFYEPFFKNKNATLATAGIIMNYKRPKIQNLIGNVAILNQKGYNIVQDGLGILNQELKFKGISTKVSFCDALCLASDLAEVWSSSDTNFNEKLNESAKSVYKTAGSIIGGNI